MADRIDYTGGDGAPLKFTPWDPDSDDEIVQVVLGHAADRRAFAEWAAARGMNVFPIPHREDDTPTYGLGR